MGQTPCAQCTNSILKLPTGDSWYDRGSRRLHRIKSVSFGEYYNQESLIDLWNFGLSNYKYLFFVGSRLVVLMVSVSDRTRRVVNTEVIYVPPCLIQMHQKALADV